MSLDYIRSWYGVPAYEGVQVEYEWPPGHIKVGTVVGAQDAHVLLDFGGPEGAVPAHPTWQLTYLDRAADAAGLGVGSDRDEGEQ